MKKENKKCSTCEEFRPLDHHLFELSEYCSYLDNTEVYERNGSNRTVSTLSFAKWFKLASELEHVEINVWKFAGSDGLYCGTAADVYDSDSKHYSSLSTHLTRFIYVSFAIEELARYLSSKYHEECKLKKIPEKKRWREPSMAMGFLIDQYGNEQLPTHLFHAVKRLQFTYEIYLKEFSPQMSGMDDIKPTQNSYGFHLVRNLRNHIAHGVFPLIENPEQVGGLDNIDKYLAELLQQSCRVTSLYAQMLLAKYNHGFLSYEYRNVERANGKAFDYFLENCTHEYANKLHLIQSFSIRNWFDDGFDLEDE